MPWRQYLEPNYQMPVRGGVCGLISIRCTPGTVCNDRKLNQPCTGWNHEFRTTELPNIDELIVRAAAADLKPLKQQRSRGSVYFWALWRQPGTSSSRCVHIALYAVRALCWPPTPRGAAIAQRAAYLWWALSRAGHHHGYELALNAGELRHLHTEVLAVVAVLRQPSK